VPVYALDVDEEEDEEDEDDEEEEEEEDLVICCSHAWQMVFSSWPSK
jgi:hypothetical protein